MKDKTFSIGDIVRQKLSIRRDNKVYYALIIRIDGEHNEHSIIRARRITAQWLNWDTHSGWEPIVALYEHIAQEWWEEVE